MFFKTNSIRLTTSSKQRSKDNSYYKEEKDSLESIANIIKQYQLEYFTSNNEKGTSEKKREILFTILSSIQKDLIFQLKEQNKKKEEINTLEVKNVYMKYKKKDKHFALNDVNFKIEKVCDVNKKCFEPIPKVDSTVIKFKATSKSFVYIQNNYPTGKDKTNYTIKVNDKEIGSSNKYISASA